MEKSGWIVDARTDKVAKHIHEDCEKRYAQMGETFGKAFMAHIGGHTNKATKGTVSTTFHGSGTAVLDVGHCGPMYSPNILSPVVFTYLNDKLLDSVPGNYKNFRIKFFFKPHDRLEIRLDQASNYMIINSLQISCKGKISKDNHLGFIKIKIYFTFISI